MTTAQLRREQRRLPPEALLRLFESQYSPSARLQQRLGAVQLARAPAELEDLQEVTRGRRATTDHISAMSPEEVRQLRIANNLNEKTVDIRASREALQNALLGTQVEAGGLANRFAETSAPVNLELLKSEVVAAKKRPELQSQQLNDARKELALRERAMNIDEASASRAQSLEGLRAALGFAQLSPEPELLDSLREQFASQGLLPQDTMDPGSKALLERFKLMEGRFGKGSLETQGPYLKRLIESAPQARRRLGPQAQLLLQYLENGQIDDLTREQLAELQRFAIK